MPERCLRYPDLLVCKCPVSKGLCGCWDSFEEFEPQSLLAPEDRNKGKLAYYVSVWISNWARTNSSGLCLVLGSLDDLNILVCKTLPFSLKSLRWDPHIRHSPQRKAQKCMWLEVKKGDLELLDPLQKSWPGHCSHLPLVTLLYKQEQEFLLLDPFHQAS